MRRCPQCACEIDAPFCPNCGKPTHLICDNCSASIQATDQFCSNCGQATNSSQNATSAGIHMGDVGVFRGTIDRSTHVTTQIGSQTNIHGPVTVQVSSTPPQPDASDLLNRGIAALETSDYAQATDLFKQSIRMQPQEAETYHYLALSLLQGKRPRLCTLSTIQLVGKHLKTATDLNHQLGHAYALWALVNYDYYVMNGIYEPSPDTNSLINQARSLQRSRVDEILRHVQAPQNRVWEWLHSL